VDFVKSENIYRIENYCKSIIVRNKYFFVFIITCK